jgi:hypothetical protein
MVIGETVASLGLQFFEVVNEFGKFAFTHTPLPADFDGRQFVVPEQAQHCSPRHVQRFTGLPES